MPADTEGLLSQALLLGELGPAVELCLKEERFAEAILLAQAGGADLLKRTQERYLAKKKGGISSVTARGRRGREGRRGALRRMPTPEGWCPERQPVFLSALTTPAHRPPLCGVSPVREACPAHPAARAGGMAEGLRPALSLAASGLCCAEELEGHGVCLQPEELERGSGLAADVLKAREVL